MISGIFGLPGSGKSVFLTKAALLALAGKPCRVGPHLLHTGQYDHVITNFPVDGCKKLDWELLGIQKIENSLLICDEIMMYADSRKYKDFSSNHIFWFSQMRKAGCDFIWASQVYSDCDKRIRNLTQNFYLCKPAPIFSSKLTVVSPIVQSMDVKQGSIQEGYTLESVLKSGLIWLPRYWNAYDTNRIIGVHELQEIPLSEW